MTGGKNDWRKKIGKNGKWVLTTGTVLAIMIKQSFLGDITVCGCAGTGRQASLRCWCRFDVWVQVPSAAPYARVVELADSLDSGSSVLYGRAGSSPASRTKGKGSRLSRDRTPLHFRWKGRQVHNDAREWWNWQTR